MKHVRTLSFVALAIAAFAAYIGASSASAAQFRSSTSPVMLYSEDTGNHVFKIDGQSVTCNKAVFEKASLTTPANTVTGLNAAYNGCTAFGFAGASVNMGNCTYTLLQPGNENMTNKDFEGNLALSCSGAANVNINSSVFGSECSVSMNATGNGNLNHLNYKNVEGGNPLTTMNVAGMTATKNKDNGLCPLSGTGGVSTATYNGPLSIVGTESINIYLE